ncbi:unnamed protein product [Cuscuta campestris]|uniref:Uncharacterized protein n=1 Tax=Cuscuta campestris TaxID=132261 RepID=A0A484NMV7_9ASTE|nr:unnamed protein product [Cuscuta campestris]
MTGCGLAMGKVPIAMGIARVTLLEKTKLADVERDHTAVAIHARAVRVYETAPFDRTGESMEVVYHDD